MCTCIGGTATTVTVCATLVYSWQCNRLFTQHHHKHVGKALCYDITMDVMSLVIGSAQRLYSLMGAPLSVWSTVTETFHDARLYWSPNGNGGADHEKLVSMKERAR